MKKMMVIVLLIGMVINLPSVNAARGCCSSHGGVDCSRIQSNGSVVCSDGWTGSSCSYSSMAKCSGYNPSSSSRTNSAPNYVYGCTDSSAKNYNAQATKNDGSCAYYTYGCKDSEAKNYNSNADKDDASCVYYTKGCMNQNAINYNSSAEKDDGSCIEKILGCMDKLANNYNENANTDDKTCKYKETKKVSNEMEVSEKGKTKTQNQDSNDVGAGILGIGTLGTAGYFLFKKFRK